MNQHQCKCAESESESDTEFLARRVDVVKSAITLLKESGVDYDAEDLLLTASFLAGENGDNE